LAKKGPRTLVVDGPERPALDSSVHFTLRGIFGIPRFGPQIMPEAWSIDGGGYYAPINITRKSSVKQLSQLGIELNDASVRLPGRFDWWWIQFNPTV